MNEAQSPKITLLRQYSSLAVSTVVIVAIVLGTVAYFKYFSIGRPVLALWAIAAIFALPRAVLGILLLVSADADLPMFMSPFLWRIFSGRLNRHRLGYSTILYFDPKWKLAIAFAWELGWFILALIPLAILV